MPPGLKKKLGPLEVWQWALIGAAIGAFILYRNRGKSEEEAPTGELFGGTGTGAYGAIDPETGIPYAFEGGGSSSDQAGGENFEDFLKKVGQIQELFPHEKEPSTETETIIEKQGREAQGEKAKEERDSGKHPATSTGAGAAAGGKSHHSAPHPSTRIAVGGAKAVTGKNTGPKAGRVRNKQQDGGVEGHSKPNKVTKQHHDKQDQGGGGGDGNRNRGGGGKGNKRKRR